MKIAHLLAGVAISYVAASTLSAETAMIELQSRITSEQIDIPEKYADLNASFDSIPEHGDFKLRVIVPDFETYAKGKHVVELNVGNSLNYGPGAQDPAKIKTPGLAVTMESGIFGALEGVSTRVKAKDSQKTIGRTILPDETQLADYGTVTIEDGEVTGFTFGWTEPDNPGLASMTRFLVERRKFPVGMGSIKIDVKTFSSPAKYGDLSLVVGLNPDVKIVMTDAKKE